MIIASEACVENAAIFPDTSVPSQGTEWRKSAAVAVLGILILLIAFWPGFDQSAGSMDEGMVLIYPELVRHGQLPYRDFETFYGPANPALLAAVFSLTGPNIFVERTVGLFYRLMILLAFFAIGLRWGKVLAGGCLLLAGCLLVGTWLTAYAWFGAMACALWSLSLGANGHSQTRCFFSGLLAGASLLFRVDLGPAIILSALPLVTGMNRPARSKYFFGAIVGLLPLALLTAALGARPVFENLFLFPVIYSSPGRHLPLFSVQSCLITIFFAHVFAALINVAAGIVAVRAPHAGTRDRLLLAVALFGLGLTHQAAQRLDSVHLLFAAFISLGILPISLLTLRNYWSRETPRWADNFLVVVIVIVCLQVAAPELATGVRRAFADGFRTKSSEIFVENRGRSFPCNTAAGALQVSRILSKLEASARPGERLFVGPGDLRRTNYCDTYFYYLTPQLKPASYFLEMNPFSANRPGSRLAGDIESADWLVLDRALDDWHEPNRSVEYGSNLPNEIVKQNFDLRAEAGPYLLYRHKVRGVAGGMQTEKQMAREVARF